MHRAPAYDAHVHARHAHEYARTIARHRRDKARDLLADLRCVDCSATAGHCACGADLIRATWDDSRCQWVSHDAEGQGVAYCYSVARTLHTLAGLVRTWPTVGAARAWARRVVAREYATR